ncbi:MAG TPA: glyoxylate/hydroxypyruvate reductase A, partial [Alphaproteobacteria bacterium]|nr:glyoxylate/hydroxypyruvate reductase A [Alphaproteobacteria bacterium]
MALVFHSNSDDAAVWRTLMARFAPGLAFHVWPDVPDPAAVRYAAVWQPPEGLFAALPGLRAVFSLGAGVEHALRRPDLPRGVPLYRLVDAG